MIECYFTPKKDTTSATICENCGSEKMLHTIGEGMKVNKVIIITGPQNDYPPTFDWSDEDIIDRFGVDDEDYMENYIEETLRNCSCGAYQLGDNGQIYKVADCCC